MSIVATAAIKAASRFMQFLPFPNHSFATSIRNCELQRALLMSKFIPHDATGSDREAPRF
jgi:hypothetical protein